MISGSQIVKEIVRYISGEIGCEAFRASLIDLRLDRADELDDHARRLLADIEGRYAEFSDGLVSEQQLKQRLQSVVQSGMLNQAATSTPVVIALTYIDTFEVLNSALMGNDASSPSGTYASIPQNPLSTSILPDWHPIPTM